MNTIDPIKITGLREFQKALKDLDGESQKQLKVVLDDVARGVAAGAARRVPMRTGRARASLRAQSSQREAKVVGGSRKVPYYAWLDFGGRVGKKKSVSRPFVTSGRYIYPTIGASRQSIAEALADGLGQLIEKAGLEVTDG
jgi:hypothetical protein